MASIKAILTQAYLEENLYEIIGKNTATRYLLQNMYLKIKFTIEHSSKELPFFTHPYKKHKWPNHHRYLPQTNRHLTVLPLQKPQPPK